MLAKLDTIVLVFALITLFFTAVNLVVSFKGKDSTKFMFLSLSSLAITICSFFYVISKAIDEELWNDISFVLPDGAKKLFIFTIIVIVLNKIPFIVEYVKKRKK